ncbi:F0F1 ATP synthase subunit epsilon [Propionibacteriaceae bacterium Y1685]|uniref:F0F1 ATP synthase subunit epsilon n=1 Tax=Microlunatus sp. Y1700 TaxID=3418487 RepID=UPI003B77A3A2
MADSLKVKVVSADRIIWEGEATNVVARTTEGDVGILPGHSPMLSVLAPSACEVVSVDGTREVFAVDGGFVSVAAGEVSVLSEFATLGRELSVSDAEKLLAEAEAMLNDADPDNDEQARTMHNRATAQLKAAHRAA